MNGSQGSLMSDAPETLSAYALRSLVLFIVYAIPALIFILCFTELGYGATVYKNLAEDYIWPNILGGVGLGLFLFLYLFDFSHWNRTCRPVFIHVHHMHHAS